MANPNRNNQPEIEKSEQELINKSFDREFNVLAVEPLVYNPTTGSLDRATKSLVGGMDYNYIDVQQTSATVETYIYKTGGSGGTTVRTIVVTYTDATKADIDTVVYS